jgi:hypothetical protein
MLFSLSVVPALEAPSVVLKQQAKRCQARANYCIRITEQMKNFGLANALAKIWLAR